MTNSNLFSTGVIGGAGHFGSASIASIITLRWSLFAGDFLGARASSPPMWARRPRSQSPASSFAARRHDNLLQESASHPVTPTVRALPRLQCLLIVLFTTTAMTTNAGPPQPSPYAFYERYIAIDDACAWPILHVLPNGELSALIWPLNVHGKVEGAAEAWISRDHGVKWRKAGIPVMNAPGTSRMNVAAGVVDGALIALVGGFGHSRPIYEENARFWPVERMKSITAASIPIPATASRSTDSGVTWSVLADLAHTARPSGRGFLIPYGRVGSTAGGSIGVMLRIEDTRDSISSCAAINGQ